MNIALSAVLIFILLVPPVIFFLVFSFVRDAKGGPKVTILDGILLSAVLSVFVHAIAISCFVHQDIRFDILLRLVSGDLKDISKSISNAEFENVFIGFAQYNAWIVGTMFILGFLLRKLSQQLQLFLRFPTLFRLRSHWWELFHGHLKRDSGYETLPFDLIFVDILMKPGSDAVIYSGYLLSFHGNGEELDRINLYNVFRRPFKWDENTEIENDTHEFGENLKADDPSTAKEIVGDVMTIAYKDILNLNIRYIAFENMSLEEIENSEFDEAEEQEDSLSKTA